jgi:hypothetical protein
MDTNERDFAGLSAALKKAATEPPREPRRRRGTIKAAVRANLEGLLALRDSGYADAEIADIFRAKGFPVSAATLRTYIVAERAARRDPPTDSGSQTQGAKRSVRAQRPTAEHVLPSVQAARPSKPTGGDVKLGHRLNDDDV